MSETNHHPSHSKGYLTQLENFLELYLVKKAPALPKGGKELLVKIAPWLVIVGLVLSVPAILSLFTLSSMMSASPYGAYATAALGPAYYISILLLVVTIVLQVLALPGLFNKKRSGWNFIFYSSLVSLVSSLISMNLVGFIIGGLLSLYLLFQVREYYK